MTRDFILLESDDITDCGARVTVCRYKRRYIREYYVEELTPSSRRRLRHKAVFPPSSVDVLTLNIEGLRQAGIGAQNART